MTTWGIVVAEGAGHLAGLGEMDFQEAAMAAIEDDERVDRLDHAGARGPATADARGQRDHGHFAPLERRFPCAIAACGPGCAARISSESSTSRISRSTGKPVAGQADPPALEVIAQLFVLDRVEAVVAANPRGLGVPLRFRAVVGCPA